MVNIIKMAAQKSKHVIRKEIKNKLQLLSSEKKLKQSEEVIKKLFNLKVFQQSNRISVYLSTEDEINTEPVVRKILNDGKLCFVPRYNANKMEMVRLTSMQDWENLPVTKWNIKQPAITEARENAIETGGLDLVIVPGVAFTKNGLRLGHGKGYYDTFLNNLTKVQKILPATVAVAFKEQILDDVPVHEYDFKIDTVLFSDI